MRHAIAVLIAISGLAPTAQAQEGIELALRAKSLSGSPSYANAPVAAKPALVPAELASNFLPVEAPAGAAAELRRPRADCETTTSDLCFDSRDRRTVYRGVREYMPRIDGLTPESMSLKRQGIVLKYSFR